LVDHSVEYRLWSDMDHQHRRPVHLQDSSVVVDIQCFNDNANEFIVKEASVVDVTTGTLLLHHIAKAPFDRDYLTDDKLRESYWQTKHCHGLDWDQGDILYHVLIDKLTCCLENRSIVYVKGLKKKQFVTDTLLNGMSSVVVVDLGDIGCGSLASINNLLSINQTRCGHHKRVQNRCALANVTLLRSWLLMSAKEPLI